MTEHYVVQGGTQGETREETSQETQLPTDIENAEAAAHSHVVESTGLQSSQMSHRSKVHHCFCLLGRLDSYQKGDFRNKHAVSHKDRKSVV